jgi:WD40 repeat protein
VALKVIKPGMDSKQVIARFEAERQALALMDHPNIAKVHDAGTTANGRPYFVMELVQGVPLTRYCDEHRLTPRQRLELFIPVCQAVQHAHQKGIIHRDLKPSNVLVTLYDGKPVPKVIDFGIAKATSQAPSEHSVFTQLGQVVGTLEYMSPEQAELNPLDIDTRSDVYSLGVILYELLTGSTPLQRQRVKQAAMLEVLRLIREEEPPTPSMRLSSTDELPSVAANRGLEPRRLSGLVRGELDWIALKALDKDRNRRYETANALALDVQRYLADEAVQACPPSGWYRFRKFARRNKVVLGTAAVVALALVTAAVALAVGELRFRAEQQDKLLAEQHQKEAEKERANAEKQRGDAKEQEAIKERQRADAETRRADAQERWRRAAYRRWLGLAQYEIRTNNTTRADEMLDSPTESPADLRGWEWYYLKRLCHPELSGVSLGTREGYQLLALSADGAQVARLETEKSGRKVIVYDAATGEQVVNFPDHGGPRHDIAFSPDGKWLATCGHDKWPATTVHVWNALTGEELPVLRGVDNPPGPAFAPEQSINAIWGVAFSPDSQLVAGTDEKGNLLVWERASGNRRFHVVAHPVPNAKQNQVWHTKVTFNHDGTQLATSCDSDEVVKVWDAETGELLQFLGTGDGFYRAAFSPNGKWLAAADATDSRSPGGGLVRVWDVRSGKSRHVFPGDHKGVTWLTFSPDEKLLATGTEETVAIWELETGREVGTYRGGHQGGVRALAFRQGGRELTSLGSDGVIKTWDATRGPECRILRTGAAWQATISNDGRRVAAAASHVTKRAFGTVVWDAENGQELTWFASDPESPRVVALSPDGRLVASAVAVGNTTGMVRIWDVPTGEVVQRRSLPHVVGQHVAAWAVAPAAAPGAPLLGPSLATAGAFAGMNWNGVGLIRNLPEQGPAAPCDAVAWSADGKLIASGGQDRIVRVWDAASGTQLWAQGGHNRTLSAVAFSRDGKRLASASGGIERQYPPPAQGPLKFPSDGPKDIPDVKVWDVARGQELRSWSFPDKGAGMALSPDGETVAVSFGVSGVKIFAAQLPGGRGKVMTATFAGHHPDVVRLYSVATGEEVAVLKGHTRPPSAVAFSLDGRRIVTGGSTDETIKLWDATTGEEIMTVGRHPGVVSSVAFSPDGRTIISTSSTADVRLWDATPPKR